MALRFKDKMGRLGTVTESLEVEYSGAWEREVCEVVREVKEDAPDDDFYDADDPMTYLIVELPESAPINEVGREGHDL